MSEKKLKLLAKVIVGGILLLFFIFGVFGAPTPGIDNEIIADHLHPFTGLDFVGVALFTACGLYLGGFLELVGFDPWVKGAGMNLAAFGVGVLGVVLMIL